MSHDEHYPPGCDELPGDHDKTVNFKAWVTTSVDHAEFVDSLSPILSEIREPSIVYNEKSLLFEISGVYEGSCEVDSRYDVEESDITNAISLSFDYNLDDFEVN